MHYVYKTTNKENGKYYVGVHKSENIQNDSYLGSGYILAKAIEKYGKESFTREILFEFETPEEAFEKEREIVNEEFVKNDQTYNIALGGHGGKLTEINPFFGKHHSEETKEILRQKSTGRIHSEESREKISNSMLEYYDSLSEEEWEELSKNVSGENNPFFGKTHSDETKEYLKTINTGRTHTEETKLKMSENSANKGVPKSEEFKDHLSKLFKGRTNEWNQVTNRNPEKIRKTAEKHRGMKRSEEACKNISNSLIGKNKGVNSNEFKGYWVTPFGKFDSLKSASEATGNSIICVRDRCLAKNENKILKFSTLKDPKISENDIGKTWKEIGWSFEPVIKEKL